MHGDLFTQAHQAMEVLLSKYLKAAITYRAIQRIESLPIPEAALREAVLNAIIHRDYAVGAPIQIRVYPDRLTIWNPGELPENWSVAKLLQPHSSRPFNPAVANAFFRAGAVEAWGRGIQRIFDACREAHAPEPQLTYEPGDLTIELAFSPEYLAVIPADRPGARMDEKVDQKVSETLDNELDNELDKKSGPTAPPSSGCAKDKHITVRQIASQLGLSRPAVDHNIQALTSQGYLVRVGRTKGGHWELPG